MNPVTYYRVVTGAGFLAGLMVATISTWIFLLSGRPVILGFFEFILVFCLVFPTVTVILWRRGPKEKFAMDTPSVTMMDPSGHVYLPENYGPPICRALKVVLYFAPGECPTIEEFIDKAVENCKKHSRFRKTPRFNAAEPWNSCFGDPELKTKEDVARHIVDWPPVETEDELREALKRIEDLQLLDNAPEWMVYRVPSNGPSRACAMLKVSHCIADGIRLSIWAESQMTGLDGAPSDWGLGLAKGEDASPWNKKRKPVRMNFLSMLRMNITTVIRTLNAPNLSDTVTPIHPENNIFKGRIVTFRMKPIPLQEFRQVAKETDSTINDVLTTVTASAIRQYCLHIDPSFRDVLEPKCRGTMAFGFPCKKGFMQSSEQLFNNFILVPIVFPIGDMTSRERLTTAKKTLFKIKNTLVAPVMQWTTDILFKLGCHFAMKDLLTNASSNLSCVFSNVRGPPERAFYCGKEILHVECSYATYTNMFLFVSYCDVMGGTFTTDVSAIKEPEILVDYIHTELKRLADEVVPPEKRYSNNRRDRWG